MANIDTLKASSVLRNKGIDLENKSILITNFGGTEQEKDLTEPSNCNGFGRIRHFKLDAGVNWTPNPLPILPAAKALNLDFNSEVRAQVFQNAICNWRCWYCFVDFKLLNGDEKYSSFLNCDELIDLYLNQDNPPLMIDLTGGQPDLTPEWIPWMMESLKKRGLSEKIFLWSDDNLSNDYLWTYLSDEQINLMSTYKMYSRVCCFKGINEVSFSVNTKADPKLFYQQFELCKKLLDIKLDLYCYLTLPAASSTNFEYDIPKFIDRVQDINVNLPLRIVPLHIFQFTPVKARMNDITRDYMVGQERAIEIWKREIQKRFTKSQLELQITEVKL